jgi:diguanylate cyclase (GGDEF)-like protein/PAS domain S-box-containing protein
MIFTAISGSYHHGLAALDVLLAMGASYAALDLAGRVTSARGRVRLVWLSCGATAMGLGIWAVHSVGMLALTLPIPVAYHLPTVFLSLFAAITASAVALYVVSQPEMRLRHGIASSLVLGGGTAATHYIGLAAMRSPAVIVYDTRVVALSILLAMAASYAGLKLFFRVRDQKRTTRRKIIGALVMGSAFSLVHYTGMWATTFYASGVAPSLGRTITISAPGVLAISASTFFVLAGAIALSFFGPFMTPQEGEVNAYGERELYFQTMAEAVPEIIWTADPNGEDDYFNRKCFDYTGMTFEQLRGTRWKEVVHPDDLDECSSKWQNALRVGEPYDVEYRIRAKDGTYRWFLGRANPIRNSTGKIIKWFGTCTDIENQKQNQQILEAQILERTTQLADANTRLQEEMLERDFARNALDQQNALMMKELEKRSERATMLAKMGELLQSCVSREEVFAAALGFAPKIFPGIRGAVALLNGGRSSAEVIGSWSGCQLPMTEFEPTACWALRTGHPHLVSAGDNTARCAHAVGIENTYLCVPILAQGETLGIVHFQASDETPQLDPSERSFKTTFAGQVGLSIANIRLREALRTQSVRDALTGLYNRRYLEEVLDREVRRAGRAGQSLAVLMIDLDHFKRFNDTYGHDAGDAVLREAAFFLLRNVRAEDFVCRYGGEEFVVILPTAGLDGARARAERLRSKMRELNIMYQGKSLGTVTFSVGVAAFPEHGMAPKDLMAAADAALYAAKRGGRNQVALASAKSADEAAIPALAKPGLETPSGWGSS